MLPTKSVWDKMSKEEQSCWRNTIDQLKDICREKGIRGFSERTLMKQPLEEYRESGKTKGLYHPYPDYKTELVKLCCLETRKSPVIKKTPIPKPIVDPVSTKKLQRNREILEEFLLNGDWKEVVENDLLMERDKGVWGYRLFCKKDDDPTRIRRYSESDSRSRVGRIDLKCPYREKAGIVYYSEAEGNEFADEMINPGFFSLLMMRSDYDRAFGCHAFDKENPKLFCVINGTPSSASEKRAHQKLRKFYFSPDRTREQYEDAFKPIYEVKKQSL